jgi:hypothetical protein
MFEGQIVSLRRTFTTFFHASSAEKRTATLLHYFSLIGETGPKSYSRVQSGIVNLAIELNNMLT